MSEKRVKWQDPPLPAGMRGPKTHSKAALILRACLKNLGRWAVTSSSDRFDNYSAGLHLVGFGIETRKLGKRQWIRIVKRGGLR